MSDFRDPFETASLPLEHERIVLVNVDLQNDFLGLAAFPAVPAQA
jgi:hypothetical protein